MPKRKDKLVVALVGNAGGHLVELQALAPAFEGHEVYYVTQDYDWTRDLADTYRIRRFAGPRLFWVRFAIYVMVSWLQIGWLWLRRRPDCIVSTGAEITIPAFYLGKLLRIRTVYVECYTRVHTPSRAAKLVMPVTDVFYSQQAPMVAHDPQRIRYAGCVL